MRNSRIGIIGNDDDPEIELLKRRVEDLGAAATVVDLGQFPKSTLAHMAGSVVVDDLDLTSLDAFYLRHMGYFSPLPRKQLTKEEWADYYERFNTYLAGEREALSFKESVIQILSELRPMINPYQVAFYHTLKVFQYWTLARSGFEIPEYMAANDFFKLREFLGRFPSVAKPLTGGFVLRWSMADLERTRDDLRKCPLLLQREIKGRMLRSFVLAGRLIGTCEIVSRPGEADSRLEILAMKPFELERHHQPVPVAACKVLGMIFAGVDLLLDEASGKIYVLECNPAPFFRNFEAQTGLAISQELARYLVEEATL